MKPMTRHKVRAAVAAGGLAVALAIACAPAAAIMAGLPQDTPAARVDPNTANSPWAGVGSLVRGGSVYTATVIGRRHVLTAAHVVSGAAPGDLVFNLNLGGDLTHSIAAARITKHPGFIAFNTPNLHEDIAVVELAADVPAATPIYALYTGPIVPGTVLTLVGYGGSGAGNAAYTIVGNAAIKRTGKNRADLFEPDDDVSNSTVMELYQFDFDGGGAANVMGTGTLGNAIETTVAPGDSGSPAFVQSGGNWVLAGVNTFVATVNGGATVPSTFGTVGGGQLVAAYAAWIREVVDAATPPGGGAGSDTDVPTLGEWGALALGAIAVVLLLRSGPARGGRPA
jgi:hypothetical protein